MEAQPPLRSVVLNTAFVPPEFVEAHGLNRIWVLPEICQAEKSIAMGRCPVAVAVAGSTNVQYPLIQAVICDQVRRAMTYRTESSAESFTLYVPSTRTAAALQWYAAELERLSKWLVRIGGCKLQPWAFAQLTQGFNQLRQKLDHMRIALPASLFLSLQPPVNNKQPHPSLRPQPAQGFKTNPKIGILMGHLTNLHLALLQEIESFGVHTVFLCGEPIPPTHATIEVGPDVDKSIFELIADQWLPQVPYLGARPNTNFYTFLTNEIRKSQLDGLLVIRPVWCDHWDLELPIIKQRAGIPVSQVVLGCEPDPTSHALNRVSALIEMVKKR